MDRMSPLDAMFLHAEDGIVHMHIASLALFEGPAPTFAELAAAIAAKLPLVPRYRQKVRFVPLDLGRPVWVDDPSFDLAYHVRHTALPPPGTDDDLRELMGRVMAQELDRRKPLWEAWMVEGLPAGRWGLISKVHHSMVDGVSGTDLMTVMLDSTPEPSEPVVDTWVPEREPPAARLAVDALASLARSPYEQLRAMRAATRAPRAALRSAGEVARGLAAFARDIAPTPPSSLEGPIGPHRRWTWTSTTLDEIRRVRGALGGTVNDVVLAAIAGGFREILLHRGEDPTAAEIRTLVPVSVRAPDQHGQYNNLVSAMVATLPVHLSDPVERLAAVRAEIARLRAAHESEAGQAVTKVAEWAFPTAVAAATRAAVRLERRFAQRNVTTVTTNVPGPPFTLYAAGRRMTDYLPYVPIAHGTRVGVAILSYDGSVAFGITGDYDTAADIAVLAKGIEASMGELLASTA